VLRAVRWYDESKVYARQGRQNPEDEGPANRGPHEHEIVVVKRKERKGELKAAEKERRVAIRIVNCKYAESQIGQ
jgi:hypothetical protein